MGTPSTDVATLQHLLQRQKTALASAEARALYAEQRAFALDDQLLLCRRTVLMLREGELPPAPLPNGSAPNASALAARCDERIEWAASQGVAEYPELYGGLNSSSPRAAFQLHLHLYVPSSGCTDPRALLLPASLDAAVNFVVVLAVCLCAVCNACALGYLRPPRIVRAALRALGCLAAPTRPSYLGSTWAREEASLRGAVAAAHSGGAAGADAGVKSEPGAGASLLSSP